ncbi:MAG: hypothetical protein WBD97_16320 [Pseudolabrys sp.]
MPQRSPRTKSNILFCKTIRWRLVPIELQEVFGIPLIRGGPISDSEIAKVARDPYIRKALQSTLIRGLQLELFFTYLRKSLLRLASETVDSDILVLFSALAQQCFINEYVYLIGDDEALQIAKWRELIEERMADGNPINRSFSLPSLLTYPFIRYQLLRGCLSRSGRRPSSNF